MKFYYFKCYNFIYVNVPLLNNCVLGKFLLFMHNATRL